MGFRSSSDNLDAENGHLTKESEEAAAFEIIRKQLDISCVTFTYLPKEMEYQQYKIMEDGLGAIVFYTYGEKNFSVTMQSGRDATVGYYAVDSNAVLRAKVKSDQNIVVQIWEVNLNEEEETYTAEFEFNQCKYMLNGKLPLEEMKKVAKYMILL